MEDIRIVGASQRVQKNGLDEWEAWYTCNKCGDEFAASHYTCRNEKAARDESDANFNRQRHRFCWVCGNKLTTSDPTDENDASASDLLAACEKAHAFLRREVSGGKEWRTVFDALEAAIAKAR